MTTSIQSAISPTSFLRAMTVAREYGMNARQLMALCHIAAQDHAKSTDLAKILRVSTAAITGVSDGLCALGFIVRHDSHHDRRICHLHITHAGTAAMNDILSELAN